MNVNEARDAILSRGCIHGKANQFDCLLCVCEVLDLLGSGPETPAQVREPIRHERGEV